MDFSKNDYIIHLLFKLITGNISDEEMEILEVWRKKSVENEKVYQHLTDTQFLQEQFIRKNAISYKRPLNDMKARIRRNVWKQRFRIIKTTAAAAVIALALGWGTYAIFTSPEHSIFENTLQTNPTNVVGNTDFPAGTVHALLTRNDGTQMELGNNPSLNKQIIGKMTEALSVEKQQELINSLSTPRGGEFKVILEDSTEVWLNAESKLIYPEHFQTNERRVKVTGEAYFKVKKDSLRPFYVETTGMQIRVYGTEFNINAYKEEKNAYATLVTGRIALQPLNGSGGELILTPGHQAIFGTDSETTKVRSVNTQSVTSWTKGRFVFEEQTLEQIMRTLARWYQFEYEFSTPDLAQTQFMGSAPRYAKLSEVLSIIEKSGGIKFTIKNKTIIISTLYNN